MKNGAQYKRGLDCSLPLLDPAFLFGGSTGHGERVARGLENGNKGNDVIRGGVDVVCGKVRVVPESDRGEGAGLRKTEREEKRERSSQ